MYFVLALLIILGILFAIDKIRPDYLALAALSLLIFSGTLSVGEGLAGFGNSTVILVALLFVIGQGLNQTGITRLIGDQISLRTKAGQENKLIASVMGSVALLSSFMSSTGVVALFVPVVQKISSNNNFNIKRLLLPVAYGGLIGGMLTLIATPPNLIISEELKNQGYEPFKMLSLMPVGLSVLVAGMLYFILINKFRKKDPEKIDTAEGGERMLALVEKYNLKGSLYRMKVTRKSAYLGKRVGETDFRARYDSNVLGIEVESRLESSMAAVNKDTVINDNDILYLLSDEENAQRISEEKRLEILPYLGVHRNRWRQQLALAEVIIPYNSNLIGARLQEVISITKSRFNVLGSNRIREPSVANIKKHVIREGDTLLVLSSKEDLKRLRQDSHDLIVYNVPFEEKIEVNRNKAFTALTITLLMILFLILNLFSPVITVLIAVLALIGTRCLTMEDAYQSISLSTVVIIAAMLPFATAMEKTGAIRLVVNAIMNFFGTGGPYLLMTGIFIVTVLLSSFISNTATAVILAPIVIKIAEESGLSPHTLVITLAIAASTAFITPVASPVNMLVVSPGRYRFMDFVKTGFPLAVITLLICLLVIPLVFPF